MLLSLLFALSLLLLFAGLLSLASSQKSTPVSLNPLSATRNLFHLFALFSLLPLHNFLDFVELPLFFASLLPLFLELVPFVLLFLKSILCHLELFFMLTHVSIVTKQGVHVSTIGLLEGGSQFQLVVSVLLFRIS
jgi:hypothetical protein